MEIELKINIFGHFYDYQVFTSKFLIVIQTGHNI